ncbi:MAG: ABC transporter substrate-binding protein [Solirubrobacterales bacterium]
MRLHIATIAVLVAAALTAGLAGCGGGGESLPLRKISIQLPTSGPLKSRAADIRRAAELELEAIDANTSGSRLELVDGPDPKAIATIDALARAPISGRDQLTISLAPPVARETRAKRGSTPKIWLLPPDALTSAARDDYRAGGATAPVTADSPFRAGTPQGTYVTPALSADNLPPAGSDFFQKFDDAYDREPDRFAIFGYEAVGLIVDALTRVEKAGEEITQTTVADAALSIRDRFSPVGHYDVLPSGQTTLYLFEARGKGAPTGQAALIEALR